MHDDLDRRRQHFPLTAQAASQLRHQVRDGLLAQAGSIEIKRIDGTRPELQRLNIAGRQEQYIFRRTERR